MCRRKPAKSFLVGVALFAVLFLSVIGCAFAQSTSTIIVDSMVRPDFTPQDGFFFLDYGEESVERVRAVLIPAPQASGRTDLSGGKWLAGAIVAQSPGRRLIRYSLLLSGSNNSFQFFTPVAWEPKEDYEQSASIADLKTFLGQRRKVLESLTVQQHAQAQSLRRLQDDADVIGNIGRIVEAQDELRRLSIENNNLVRDIARLNDFFTLAKTHPAPKNQSRRELELTASLSELTEAARQAEAGEMSRRGSVETELQNKLSAIESTRYDDSEALQRELVALRKERMELEKLAGGERN